MKSPQLAGADFLIEATDDPEALCFALELASACINERGISLAEYRDRWMEHRRQVSEWPSTLLTQYHGERKDAVSLATTWLTTFVELSAPARTLLQMLAWLAPEPIPQGLVDHPSLAEEWRKLSGDSSGDISLALDELRRFVLHGAADDSSAGKIHPLVQQLTRDRLEDPDRQAALQAILEAINGYTPYDVDEKPDQLATETIDSHLAAIIDLAEAENVLWPTARLTYMRGKLLFAKKQHGEAETALHRALSITEKAYGSDHHAVARCLSKLAELFAATDRLSEAEKFQRRAIEIAEKSGESEMIELAMQLANLGLLLADSDRNEEAEPLLRRALAIAEKNYAADDSNLTCYLGNLARTLVDLKRYAEAESLLRRALEVKEKAYGGEHPSVAHTLASLARVLYHMERCAEAEPFARRAVAIDEKTGGDNPGCVITHRITLVAVLGTLRQYAACEPFLRRTIVEILESQRETGREDHDLRSHLDFYTYVLQTMRWSQRQIDTAIRGLYDEAKFSEGFVPKPPPPKSWLARILGL